MQARLISISQSAVILGEADSLSLTLNFEDADFRQTVKARGYKWHGTSKTWQFKGDIKAELAFLFANGCYLWGRATDAAEIAVLLGFETLPAAIVPGEIRQSSEYTMSEPVELQGAPAWRGVTITPNADVIRARYF